MKYSNEITFVLDPKYTEDLLKNVNHIYNTTIDEILLLHRRFPDNIQLFTSSLEDNLVAGVVIFKTTRVAHLQYIAASAFGRETSALDLLIEFLIGSEGFRNKYIDFGISTEQNGQYLNKGLIDYKEGFGGSAVSYDLYRWEISGEAS